MSMKNAYPRPDQARSEWMNLNGVWDFSFNKETLDGTIEVPYPWGSPLSGVPIPAEKANGTGYYRKKVIWNPEGKQIVLHFGAVDYFCKVFVNGNLVGTHTGGYAAFEFDVTAFWDRSGENEIRVEATDTAQRSQTYGKQGYGDARGIWQTVWLEARPEVYIASFFTRTKIDGTVTIEVETVGAADGSLIRAGFHEAGNTLIYPAQAQVSGNRALLELKVNDPKLWSPESPVLYEGTILLGEDAVSTYFGIREIGTGVFGTHQKRYITLNGKPYFLFGVLDQSFNPQGYFTLPSDEDCREEILRLKRIGINMTRIHIKAEEPLKLYWADRLGLLVMADFPCFWGDPEPETRMQYEQEFEAQIRRDRNHPSIFYWVVFNETWGLFHHEKRADGTTAQIYRDETAQWVVSCYHKVKEMDPTRLVEDNSVCNQDHTETDVNTWHFYSNGYEKVRKVISDFCAGAYEGSQKNYKKGWTMGDVPCMNSECGNVWGVVGNAGESDISWQYKYMMNEFRLHDTLCGFIFTEFHDVVNEFNGYYKLDNSDKDFGYSDYGMTLRDLHSPDFLAADFAPMTTVRPGEEVTVPLYGSSFSDRHHGKDLSVIWSLTAIDPMDGDFIAQEEEFPVHWADYGSFPAGDITLTMPEHDGTAVLCFALYDADEIIMQNCVLFDIDGGKRTDALVLEPAEFTAEGWERDLPAQQGYKRSGLGSGAFRMTVETAAVPELAQADDLRIVFEASTREPMTHDYPSRRTNEKADANYMLGYRCDPGENPNSFAMTDTVCYPGFAEVLIDGNMIGRIYLPDDPADSRGALSHHYQAADDHLDEAGSYGTLCDLRVPSGLLFKLKEKETFDLTIRTQDDHGLSLFGRRSGRFGIGVVLRAE